MKTENRTTLRKTKMLFAGLLLMGGSIANAQIDLPGTGDPNIPDAPIDGFLAIGLIAGAGVGVRKRIKGLKN